MSQENSPVREFLTAVFPEISPSWLLLWGAPSKHSEFVQTVTDETLTMIDAWAQRENVYVGCGLRSQNFGPTMRGGLQDVTGIPGLWLDIDYGKEHSKPNLPPTQEAAQGLLDSLGLAPSILVHSGRGLQAWWLFHEPWTFDSEAERAQAELLTKGWNNTLRAKARAKNWDADQVGDLPRVMRLPGTWNRKSVPRKVELLSLDPDRRYQPSDFEAYMLADALQPKEAMPDLSWEFRLSPEANPPANKFLLLCESDLIFKKSWLHARPDLPDQSASSYDMSLATRALLAGWTGQEIVNLLIAHRRNFREDLKLREDYYKRTLNRAARDKDIDERQRILEDIKAGKELPEHVKHDKAELLALLNQGLFPNHAHKITKILQITGDPDTYQVEMDGQMLSMGPVEHITSQTKFSNLIVRFTRVLPERQKGKAWDAFVQRMLDIVEVVNAGAESTPAGAMETWMNQYLQSEHTDEEHWERAMMQGYPFRHKGKLYITSAGVLKFIIGRCHEKMTTMKLAQHLRTLGWLPESLTYRPAKNKSQTKHRSVWSKPGL